MSHQHEKRGNSKAGGHHLRLQDRVALIVG